MKLFSFILACFLLIEPLFARVHLGLDGKINDNFFGLKSQKDRNGSFSVSFDISSIFQIGLTHRQTMKVIEGYHQIAQNAYAYVKDQTHTIENSLDFIFILYAGRKFIPYLQFGAVKKQYKLARKIANLPSEKVSITNATPLPNGGLGVGFRLSRSFTLKISHIVSPGYKIRYPGEPNQSILDSYTKIGVSYGL